MSTTTRHIGFCPVCARNFKVRGNKLVHHGYKRPGHGFIVGDCMGALATPHELSPDLAKRYRKLICNAVKSALKAVVSHSVATKMTLTKREWDRKTRQWAKVHSTITPESYEWKSEFRNCEWSLQREVRVLQTELNRITELVDTWELKALTSREEEKSAKQAAKAVREAKKTQAKQDKVNTQASKYQKRIDSALKTKNSNTLAEIWESCQSKFRDIDDSLTKAECITLLERDEVWAAFGLSGLAMSPWSAPNKPEKAALRRMKNRMDRVKGYHEYVVKPLDERDIKRLQGMSLEWPQELGGENKKGAKTLTEVQARIVG